MEEILIMSTTKNNLPLKTCVKVDDYHCLNFKSASECQLCEDGYYLNNDKKCETTPETSVPNCIEYDEYLNC